MLAPWVEEGAWEPLLWVLVSEPLVSSGLSVLWGLHDHCLALERSQTQRIAGQLDPVFEVAGWLKDSVAD